MSSTCIQLNPDSAIDKVEPTEINGILDNYNWLMSCWIKQTYLENNLNPTQALRPTLCRWVGRMHMSPAPLIQSNPCSSWQGHHVLDINICSRVSQCSQLNALAVPA